MRIMTIAAGHASALHATLHETAPFEDLALHLAISVMRPACRGTGAWVSRKRAPGCGSATIGRARAWQGAQLSSCAAAPPTAHCRAHPRRQSARRRPKHRADADLGPGRVVAITRRGIFAGDACGVAGGAYEVPVLVAPGPVQRVARWQRLIRHQMVPALAALLGRAAAPRPRQNLPPAVGEEHEVLLQRIHAEGLTHRKIGGHTVRAVGADQAALALTPEARGVATIGHSDPRKVARDIRRRRGGHRAGVIALVPGGDLVGVAAGAGGGAYEAHKRALARDRCGGAHEERRQKERQAHEQQQATRGQAAPQGGRVRMHRQRCRSASRLASFHANPLCRQGEVAGARLVQRHLGPGPRRSGRSKGASPRAMNHPPEWPARIANQNRTSSAVQCGTGQSRQGEHATRPTGSPILTRHPRRDSAPARMCASARDPAPARLSRAAKP